jgi:hypothetical protein
VLSRRSLQAGRSRTSRRSRYNRGQAAKRTYRQSEIDVPERLHSIRIICRRLNPGREGNRRLYSSTVAGKSSGNSVACATLRKARDSGLMASPCLLLHTGPTSTLRRRERRGTRTDAVVSWLLEDQIKVSAHGRLQQNSQRTRYLDAPRFGPSSANSLIDQKNVGMDFECKADLS